jgi:hypothetical protein
MEAVNLTLAPVELDPKNGPGTLAPADGSSDDYRRDLEEVTDREKALADAGTIALLDSKGRKRNPDPPAPDGGES